jgi:hypothetical protein
MHMALLGAPPLSLAMRVRVNVGSGNFIGFDIASVYLKW